MTFVSVLNSFAQHVAGVVKQRSVPKAGATGQVLRKKSGTDFDTEWVNPPTGTGGTPNTVVINATATGNQAWAFDGPTNFLKLTLTGATTLANPTGMAPGEEGILLVSGNHALTFGDAYRGGTTTPLTYSGASKLFRFVADDTGKAFLQYVNEVNPYNDPFWLQTALLIGTNGVNNATNNVFVDSSPNNVVITRGGNVTQGRVNGVNVGSFDGTGDYLALPVGALNFGTADFTIETDVTYADNSQTRAIFSMNSLNGEWRTGGGYLMVTSYEVQYLNTAGGPGQILLPAQVPGVKQHIALTKSGTTLKVFVNGALFVTRTDCAASLGNATERRGIGVLDQHTAGGRYFMMGTLSNYRISNTVRYAAAFTPPTSPFTSDANTLLLLNFANAGIVDRIEKTVVDTVGTAKVSTTVTRFGEAVIQTSGGGVVCAPIADYNLGTSDFALQISVYPTSGTGFQCIAQKRSDSASAQGFVLANNGGALHLFASSNGSGWDIANAFACGSLTLNAWNDIALVRQGSTWRVFNNAVQVGTFTSAAAIQSNTHPLCIGSDTVASSPLQGYVTLPRLTRAARPIAALTAPFPIG